MTDRTAIKQEVGRTLLSFAEALDREDFGPKVQGGPYHPGQRTGAHTSGTGR
jgi:hypothetical protein